MSCTSAHRWSRASLEQSFARQRINRGPSPVTSSSKPALVVQALSRSTIRADASAIRLTLPIAPRFDLV
jgi:hypothetical protein